MTYEDHDEEELTEAELVDILLPMSPTLSSKAALENTGRLSMEIIEKVNAVYVGEVSAEFLSGLPLAHHGVHAHCINRQYLHGPPRTRVPPSQIAWAVMKLRRIYYIEKLFNFLKIFLWSL